jgi:hypothetical protein
MKVLDFPNIIAIFKFWMKLFKQAGKSGWKPMAYKPFHRLSLCAEWA